MVRSAVWPWLVFASFCFIHFLWPLFCPLQDSGAVDCLPIVYNIHVAVLDRMYLFCVYDEAAPLFLWGKIVRNILSKLLKGKISNKIYYIQSLTHALSQAPIPSDRVWLKPSRRGVTLGLPTKSWNWRKNLLWVLSSLFSLVWVDFFIIFFKFLISDVYEVIFFLCPEVNDFMNL